MLLHLIMQIKQRINTVKSLGYSQKLVSYILEIMQKSIYYCHWIILNYVSLFQDKTNNL